MVLYIKFCAEITGRRLHPKETAAGGVGHIGTRVLAPFPQELTIIRLALRKEKVLPARRKASGGSVQLGSAYKIPLLTGFKVQGDKPFHTGVGRTCRPHHDLFAVGSPGDGGDDPVSHVWCSRIGERWEHFPFAPTREVKHDECCPFAFLILFPGGYLPSIRGKGGPVKDPIFETAQGKCRCFFGGKRLAIPLRRLYQVKRLFGCNEKFLPPRVGAEVSNALWEPPAEKTSFCV